MRIHRVIWLILLIMMSAVYANGADTVDPNFTFPASVPGQKLEILGTFPDPEQRRTILLVASGQADAAGKSLPAEVSADTKKLSFVLTDVPPGSYAVKIKLNEDPLVAAGQLEVSKPVAADATVEPAKPKADAPKVKVEKVEPVSYYPNDQGRYSFVITGTNFADVPTDNRLEIDRIPVTTVPCPTPSPTPPPSSQAVPAPDPKPCIRKQEGAASGALVVEDYAVANYTKPLQVGLRVGENVSEGNAITFSRFKKTNLRLLATAAFFALLLIVYLLVRTGVRLGKIEGRFASLRAFLLDKDTNSYSLSKFQLLLFTLVSIFGYIYVFICRLAVQWAFVLPDVPDGLPTLMGVSLGTAVVATGVASNIGAKGAGPDSPSFADFISSGGVVLPERFQFFLWTIVSSVGVLVLVLASDPATLQKLPTVPDGMLYLIGLSSAGYLGGKLARGPGPNITSIDVGKVPSDAKPPEKAKPQTPAGGGDTGEPVGLEITITGSNLSPKATFQLDEQRIPVDQVEVVSQTPEGQSLKLCSSLTVRLWYVASRYLAGQHLLRIINEDSQGADAKFGAVIDSITKEASEPPEVKVLVTGSSFKDPSSARWSNAADLGAVDPAKAIGVDKITRKSDTELLIVLPPGTAGEITLTIVSPKGLETSKNVSLGDPAAGGGGGG